jgi:hypothetical protein
VPAMLSKLSEVAEAEAQKWDALKLMQHWQGRRKRVFVTLFAEQVGEPRDGEWEEVAAKLGITADAVKQRWQAWPQQQARLLQQRQARAAVRQQAPITVAAELADNTAEAVAQGMAAADTGAAPGAPTAAGGAPSAAAAGGSRRARAADRNASQAALRAALQDTYAQAAIVRVRCTQVASGTVVTGTADLKDLLQAGSTKATGRLPACISSVEVQEGQPAFEPTAPLTPKV